ncbi:hypothetical protein ZEAMMB73_Zm00001d021833 [Zea mays]|uniref:Uncharacterized protein n=1 Tax=Zea mays TaxID=4577 RepID=A0A1D6IGW3_MAIZE|nr:hypothetical protein ZEAMMB73_Zm00001d021833 [Zea mays]
MDLQQRALPPPPRLGKPGSIGDSSRRWDLVFSVVKPSVIQLRGPTKVSVFIASNDGSARSLRTIQWPAFVPCPSNPA